MTKEHRAAAAVVAAAEKPSAEAHDVVVPDLHEMRPNHHAHSTLATLLASMLLACPPTVVKAFWDDLVRTRRSTPSVLTPELAVRALMALWAATAWQLVTMAQLHSEQQRAHFRGVFVLWLRCADDIPACLASLSADLCIANIWQHEATQLPASAAGMSMKTCRWLDTIYNLLFVACSGLTLGHAVDSGKTVGASKIEKSTCDAIKLLISASHYPQLELCDELSATTLPVARRPIKDLMMAALLQGMTKPTAGASLPSVVVDGCFVAALPLELDRTAACLLPALMPIKNENCLYVIVLGAAKGTLPETYQALKQHCVLSDAHLRHLADKIGSGSSDITLAALRATFALKPEYLLEEPHSSARGTLWTTRYNTLMAMFRVNPVFAPLVREALAVMHLLEPELQPRLLSLATLVLDSTSLPDQLVSYIVQYETEEECGGAEERAADETLLHVKIMQHLGARKYATPAHRKYVKALVGARTQAAKESGGKSS